MNSKIAMFIAKLTFGKAAVACLIVAFCLNMVTYGLFSYSVPPVLGFSILGLSLLLAIGGIVKDEKKGPAGFVIIFATLLFVGLSTLPQ